MPLALLAAVVHLALAPHGAHGVRGSVTLEPAGARMTRVVVTLAVHDSRLRPVHIHGGRCGAFFGLPFGAHRMRGNRAAFVVHVPLRTLRGAYAIDVHAAPSSPSWIACANL